MMSKVHGVEVFTEGHMFDILNGVASSTAKKVVLSMMKEMAKDMNTVTVNGDTMQRMVLHTGMSASQIRNGVSEAKALGLVEATGQLRAEYIVNPALAIKGNDVKVWKMYGAIERDLGNTAASVLPDTPIVLEGKAVALTNEDLVKIGEYTIRTKSRKSMVNI
jgi:hypothetical protein